MIRHISDQWEEIKEGVRPVKTSDTQQLQAIVRQIGKVRDALRTMCKVSVSRTSLKNAVREALIPVIQEHRDELFPEIVALRERLALADEDPTVLDIYRGVSDASGNREAVEDFRQRLEGFESRVSELGSAFQGEIGVVRGDLAGVDAKVDAAENGLTQVRSSVDHQVGAVQHRIEEVQGAVTHFEDQLKKVESSIPEQLERIETTIPEQAKAAADEVEQRLRKEIEDMVEQLSGRLAELREMLARVEQTVPSKGQLTTVDERLGRLEQSFERVSEKVSSIDETTPELRRLSHSFQEVRELIGVTTDRLHAAGEEVGVAVRSQMGTRLDELECVLRDGIRRWESDQSGMASSLTQLRDALRDQLGEFTTQVEGAQGSLWGKLTGRKEPGLKLTAEEFDVLSDKLEGVIGGLEGVISKRKPDEAVSDAAVSDEAVSDAAVSDAAVSDEAVSAPEPETADHETQSNT